MSNPHRQQKLDLAESKPLTSVEEYQFEPIRGYPMLHWAGKHPFTSTQYYPAQHKETYGPEVEGWRNKLYWGDNLQVMSHLLKEYRSKVKLIYIDPPYDSKAEYKLTIKVRGKSTISDQSMFEDKQYTDIWANDDYLQFMYERLILIRELLTEDGSLYLHCDWHKSHYLRLILDEVFGPDNFVNEIVWKRTSAHNDPRRWGVIHDVLFFYSKTGNYTWNIVYQAYDQSYLDVKYRHSDERGIFRLSDLTAPGATGGDSSKPWRGYDPGKLGRHWSVARNIIEALVSPTNSASMTTQEKLDILDQNGYIYWTPRGRGGEAGFPQYKRYIGNGTPIQDVITDLDPVNSQASERTDYPTQKPEPLLERVIQASSNPGDLVFDCFMGSGTTQEAALRLGRRFLGADINLGAIQITTKRLLDVASELQAKPLTLDLEEGSTSTFFTGFEVYNVNNYDLFRNPVQAKELLIQALEVNPLQPGSLFDGEKDGRMVKIMPINRIATRQDLNELITGLDLKAFERRQAEHPNQPVEKIMLVCMGHEPDLAAHLLQEVNPYKLDVEVVDILRDKQDLQFKRDAEAKIIIRDGELVIEQFYPMNLLAKLSLQQEYVEDWRELVDSVMVDWNYDGAVLQPAVIDVPEEGKLVAGHYRVPADAGTIRVKITDLLSESLEMELVYG